MSSFSLTYEHELLKGVGGWGGGGGQLFRDRETNDNIFVYFPPFSFMVTSHYFTYSIPKMNWCIGLKYLSLFDMYYILFYSLIAVGRKKCMKIFAFT